MSSNSNFGGAAKPPSIFGGVAKPPSIFGGTARNTSVIGNYQMNSSGSAGSSSMVGSGLTTSAPSNGNSNHSGGSTGHSSMVGSVLTTAAPSNGNASNNVNMQALTSLFTFQGNNNNQNNGTNHGGQSAPPPFNLFPHMPLEMQIEVARQSFNKPAIHWVRLERDLENAHAAHYEVKMRPTLRGMDPSSFREHDKKLKNFVEMGLRTTDVYVEPMTLGFPRLLTQIDAATDMVCVHDIFKSGVMNNVYRAIPSFHRNLQKGNLGRPVMERQGFTNMLSGIRRVGVMVTEDWYHKKLFCCPSITGLHGLDEHRRFPMCPLELAAFFDCCPDLEVAYLVMKRTVRSIHGLRSYPFQADDYADAYFKQNTAGRQALDIEIFYDSEQKYLEFTDACNQALKNQIKGTSVPEIVRLADETRFIFTDQYEKLPLAPNNMAYLNGVHEFQCLQHTMSRERRNAVKFKVLLTTGCSV